MTDWSDLDYQARAMRELFDGRKDIYGVNKGTVYRAANGKEWPDAVWRVLMREHLEGKPEADLGVYPVRDDSTVMFAAVDIDEPDYALAMEVADTMPTEHAFIERSRSGNYHVFVFFDEPLEAWAARAVLRGVIVTVGRPDLEIFPKQDGLKPGMVGNYISIPWHGDERPTVREDDEPWLRTSWMRTALMNRTSAESWRRRGKALGGRPREQRESESDFGERNSLHVCADYIVRHREDNPLGEGHRATVLFNLAKMFANCRQYDEDETLQFVEAVNQAGTSPIPSREVKRFVTNAYEGGFTSTGCDDPLMMPYVSPECRIANG